MYKHNALAQRGRYAFCFADQTGHVPQEKRNSHAINIGQSKYHTKFTIKIFVPLAKRDLFCYNNKVSCEIRPYQPGK